MRRLLRALARVITCHVAGHVHGETIPSVRFYLDADCTAVQCARCLTILKRPDVVGRSSPVYLFPHNVA